MMLNRERIYRDDPLDNILHRMQAHQRKKRRYYSASLVTDLIGSAFASQRHPSTCKILQLYRQQPFSVS
jgi:hypothetical protein